MQINVTFSSTEEMKEFCQLVAGAQKEQGCATSHKAQENAKATASTPAVRTSVTPASAPVAAVPTTPMAQQPAPVTPPTPAAAVPTSTATYTLDDLARAAMTLMDTGRQVDLQQLLARFGVDALPALPQTQYGAFATALRGMGAQI